MREWTSDDLTRVCREWQRELFLDRWRIDISFERYNDFGEDGGAHIHFSQKSLGATIHILQPSDWNSNWGKQQDIEQDIVHELLHLVIAPLVPTETESSVNEEQAIVTISRTLTKLKRFFSDE